MNRMKMIPETEIIVSNNDHVKNVSLQLNQNIL